MQRRGAETRPLQRESTRKAANRLRTKAADLRTVADARVARRSHVVPVARDPMEAGSLCCSCVCVRRVVVTFRCQLTTLLGREEVVSLYEVDFIPVGDAGRHGDAIAVRFTNPEDGNLVSIVIDAGFSGTGDAIVDHFDRWYGTRNVNIAILTHPDGDHIGGMGTVVRELNVATLCVHRIDQRGGSSLPAAAAVAELVELAESHGTHVVEAFAGSHAFGGALQILGPTEDYYNELVQEQVAEERAGGPGPVHRAAGAVRAVARRFLDALPGEVLFDDAGGTNARNNSSTVALLTVDGRQMLFTADAGAPALERAWDFADENGLAGDAPYFLDVPHHGSRRNGSSDLYNRLFGAVGQAPTRTAFVNVAPEAEKHPNPKIANALMRRGYRVNETKGQAIRHNSDDAPARPGWTSLTPLSPFDETGED
jgi:beta-lactamase superfamily II metal-dependent hydrolase